MTKLSPNLPRAATLPNLTGAKTNPSAGTLAGPGTAVSTAEPAAPAALSTGSDLRVDSNQSAAANAVAQIMGTNAADPSSIAQLEVSMGAALVAEGRSEISGNILTEGTSAAMESRWSEYVGKVSTGLGGGPIDVNALVQMVLREAYQENTQDLRFFAEKVKFFNNVKKTIRAEMTRGREVLSTLAGEPENTPIAEVTGSAFRPNDIQTTFTGGTEVVTTEADNTPRTFSVALNSAWFATGAQGADGAANSVTGTSAGRYDPYVIDLNNNGLADLEDHPEGIFDSLGTRNSTTVTEERSFDVSINTYSGAEQGMSADQIADVIVGQAASQGVTISHAQGLEIWNGGGGGLRLDATSTVEVPVQIEEERMYTQWVAPGDGMLVIDLNGDGQISHDEQFGTDQISAQTDLANRMDGNSDGVVDANDAGFSDLRVWQDSDSDGQVDPGELISLADANLGDGIELDQTSTSATHSGELADGDNNAVLSASSGALIYTKTELETYVQGLEEQLASVGDDAQLANVDLQNNLQKQQQTLQMMSNISKMLHDTAMAIVRKIG